MSKQQKGTTMNKQELIDGIEEDYTHLAPAVETIVNAVDTAGWLHNPDQVPGRTITESEFKWAIDAQYGEVPIDVDEMRSFAACLGLTIVPDPEPTNAEKLAELLAPYARGFVPESMGSFLDQIGVKAPGGGDA